MVSTSQEAVQVFQQRVFLVHIKISSPCGQLTLDSAKLRDSGVHEAIKRSNGKSRDAFPIFEIVGDDGKPIVSASKAVTALNSKLDAIQAAFMLSSGDRGSWYVPESKIEALEAALVELEEERDRLREELLENHQEAFELFQCRLADILSNANLMELYQELEAKFPCASELEAKLDFEVLRWEPIPSLEEIQEQAGKDATLKRQAEVVQKTIDLLQHEAPRIMDEIYGCIEVICTVLERCNPKGLTDYYVKRIQENSDRVETLLGLWDGTFGSENEQLTGMYRRLQGISRIRETGSGDELIRSLVTDSIRR